MAYTGILNIVSSTYFDTYNGLSIVSSTYFHTCNGLSIVSSKKDFQ